MTLVITVAGTPVNFDEDSWTLHQKLDERWECAFTVLDYPGSQFLQRGMKVVATDSALGLLFTGFLIDDKQDKTNTYPDTTIEHQVETTDGSYLIGKRTSNLVYATPQQAGKIIIDMVRQNLAAEGIIAHYAVDQDSSQADFARGALSNVVAANSVGDGDLELAFSASATASWTSAAAWLTGTLTNVQANAAGDLSLVGVVRTWNDGSKAGQTLFGTGASSDAVVNGQYQLPSRAGNELRSRLDFAGTWGNAIIECDVVLAAGDSGGNLRHGIIARQTVWNNIVGGYAYLLNMTSTFMEIRRGSNGGSSGSNVQLTFANFSPSLGAGTYRLRFVVNGNTLTGYVNGVQYCTVTDTTYPTAGGIGLRNNNQYTNATQTEIFDNFGVVAAFSGTWQSAATSINAVSSVSSSVITWDQSLSTGGTVLVQTSIDGGSTWQTVTSGGAVNPGLTKGSSGVGKTVLVKITLSTTNTSLMPDIQNLQWTVVGGYQASGSRSTVPLGNDTMIRANQSGWGTSTDGQTWNKIGTGTDTIASNEATVLNPNQFRNRLGSVTAGDQEAVVRFMLSNSGTIGAGLVLRFVDANNLYQSGCSLSTTNIIKISAGLTVVLVSLFNPLTHDIFYWMRFRVTGDGTVAPVLLQTKIWVDGTLEPAAWTLTATD